MPPVDSIFVNTPYFTGKTEALCMSEPIYDLILGNIPGIRDLNKPDNNWKIEQQRVEEKIEYKNTKISCVSNDNVSVIKDEAKAKEVGKEGQNECNGKKKSGYRCKSTPRK